LAFFSLGLTWNFYPPLSGSQVDYSLSNHTSLNMCLHKNFMSLCVAKYQESMNFLNEVNYTLYA
jgi:hypothetical protein